MTLSTTTLLKKLLLVFLVIAGLHFAKGFLIPLIIGGILATLFLPLCKWMEARSVHRGGAVLIVFVCILLLIASIITLLTWKISEFAHDFVFIKHQAMLASNKLQSYVFQYLGISLAKQSQILIDEQPALSTVVGFFVSSMSALTTNFVLAMVYVVSLLYYRGHLFNFILKLAKSTERSKIEQVVESVTQVSQQYLLGLSKMIFLLWIMYGVGFSLLGVENAILFAILCGLLEIVPFVGNITGTTLTVLVAAVHGASLTLLAGIVVTYLIVQFIQGWLLEPLILGPQVKINPLFTIVALVLGQLIWGIPGIILAIPVTAMLKIVCDHVEVLHPYGFLIGEIEPTKPRRKVLLYRTSKTVVVEEKSNS